MDEPMSEADKLKANQMVQRIGTHISQLLGGVPFVLVFQHNSDHPVDVISAALDVNVTQTMLAEALVRMSDPSEVVRYTNPSELN